MVNTEQLSITDYCVSRLVDARNAILDYCLALLPHILNLAVSERLYCPKTFSVHKITFNEAEGTAEKADFLLRRHSVLRLTLMNNEPFGKR